VFYFAYGMNLDPSYMAGDMHERGPATLANWKLVFRGLANVEPASTEYVLGALWEIDEAGLRRLDRREGYIPDSTTNLYDRVTVLVDNGDEQVEAIMYVMADATRAWRNVQPPDEFYLEIIHTGYKHFHLGEDALWKSVREACSGGQEFNALRYIVEKGAEQHA
jgi:gamma-glutamylcyclotransferase (GGCT)/AIG2-like uncharacterized protein YtfP